MSEPHNGGSPMNPVPPPEARPFMPRSPHGGQGEQPPKARQRLRLLIAMGLAVLVLCATATFVILRMRSGGSAAPAAAAASADPADPAAPTLRAVVTLPDGQPRGVLRVTPAFDAPVAGYVPAGGAVEITRSVTDKGQTWHRVKTTGSPPLSGWMNAGILKQQ